MKIVREFIKDFWRHIALGVAVVVLGYFLIFFGMGSVTPGFSTTEIASHSNSSSLSAIWANPLNVLFKLVLWVPIALGNDSVILTRVVAGAFAVLSVGLFYFIVYGLFSRRIAVVTSLLFATSSGFLHAAHLGTPLVLQIFSLLTLVALVPMYLITKRKVLSLYLTAIVIAVTLYTPGMFWFVAIGIAVLNKRLFTALRGLAVKHQIIISFITIGLIAPLIWAIYKQPSLALTSLALPNTLPTWADIASRTSDFATSLFWSGTGPAEIMLVGAPLLSMVEFGLIFIGLGLQFTRPRLKSNFFVVGATVLVLLLISLGGALDYVSLTPIFGLLMAGGIFYLFKQWYKVFPVNPVAHVVGVLLMFILIATPVFYHLQAFFVAWPHSTATHAAFSKKQPRTVNQSEKARSVRAEPSSLTF